MSQEDFFQRASFAVDLIRMAKDMPTPFSFGLDAEWGAGKTFFVNNLLLAEANKQKLPCVIYDAFEHEKESDVFLSLMASILEQVQAASSDCPNNPKVSGAISKVCKGVGRVVANAGFKLLLKQSAEEVEAAFEDNSGATSIVSETLEKEVLNFLERRLSDGKSYKALKLEFQTSIKSLAYNLSESRKILIVIDELDRCTPSHALKVLEATNHILNTEGLVFLFSYNHQQLGNMVAHTYGAGINSAAYIQKFITFAFKFPITHPAIFKSASAKLMQDKATTYPEKNQHSHILQALINRFDKINEHIALPPRLVHNLTSILLTVDETMSNLFDDFMSPTEIGIFIIFRLTNPSSFSRLIHKHSSVEEVKRAMFELKYVELIPPNRFGVQNYITQFLLKEVESRGAGLDEFYANLQVFNTLTNRN